MSKETSDPTTCPHDPTCPILASRYGVGYCVARSEGDRKRAQAERERDEARAELEDFRIHWMPFGKGELDDVERQVAGSDLPIGMPRSDFQRFVADSRRARAAEASAGALRARVSALEGALRECLGGGAFKHPQIVERARAALAGGKP